jgi:hypothetical protein
MSFFITAIIQLHQHLLNRQEDTNQATTNTVPNSSIISRRNNRRPRPRRHNYRYRRYRIDPSNNFARAHLILRARQITERNRELARLAEQTFIDAILQARTETENRQADAVQHLRTRNERPARTITELGPVFTRQRTRLYSALRVLLTHNWKIIRITKTGEIETPLKRRSIFYIVVWYNRVTGKS